MDMRQKIAAGLVCLCAAYGCGDDDGQSTGTGGGGAGSGGIGGTAGSGGGAEGGSGGGASQTPFEVQVARGASAYADACAACHGADGSGSSDAPPLVGDGALPKDPPPTAQVRASQFITAGDVLAFVEVNMPGDAPGSLDTATYVDIIAFALFANGVTLEDELTEQALDDVVINPD